MSGQRRTSGPQKGHVYVARHLQDGERSGYYVVASAVKQTVEQRVKFENARFPVTEFVASFEAADAVRAENEAKNRLQDMRLGLVRGFPDKRKPPSNAEWLFNQEKAAEDDIVACVRETCEEFKNE